MHGTMAFYEFTAVNLLTNPLYILGDDSTIVVYTNDSIQISAGANSTLKCILSILETAT